MDSTSFNLLLLNLIIGLVRNHPFYRPFSSQINLHEYKLFGVERKFKCGVRDMTPELIACSEKNQHTVMLETTAMGGLNNKKQTQIEWYLRVTSNDLINSAGITVQSAQSHSLWVIVTPDAVNEYQAILEWERSNGLMLSSFATDPISGYSLIYFGGDLADSQLENILKPGFQTARIYQGYVTIDTANMGEVALVKPVMQQFVSAVVKDNLEIRPEEIARSLIKVWSSYDTSARAIIVTSINKVLRRFSSKPYTEKMLIADESSDLKWSVVFPANKEIAASKAKLYRAAARYQAELSGGIIQLDLEF